MKKATIIAAAVAGLTSIGLGHLYFQRLEAEVSGGPKVSVLVAARDVPSGGTISKELVAVREIPQAYVEQRHVRSDELKKVLNAKVSGGLRANDAILWTDLDEFSDEARVLSGLVKQGMRAVPISGRDVGFDGLLRPGDRVDVLLTVGADGQGQGSTRTLLQNLMVLSVGSTLARPGEVVGRIRGSGGVTLSASVENAQVLAQARRRGLLSLTLRNTDDITIMEGLPETSNSELTQLPAVKPTSSVARAVRGRLEHVD